MTVDEYAQVIWDYMKMGHVLKKCDAILVLGSIDERVAEYGAQLLLDGHGNWLILSGGVAHDEDNLRVHWQGTEAGHFADIAMKMGVPKDKIIIENHATNTGENITYTYELLMRKNMQVQSLLLVQKPYMERRTYATFKKQWPGEDTEIIVSSPLIEYKDYFDEHNPKERVLNIMVGDLQRIKEYPKLGFQIEQEIPSVVWTAYEKLVAAGYDKHLING